MICTSQQHFTLLPQGEDGTQPTESSVNSLRQAPCGSPVHRQHSSLLALVSGHRVEEIFIWSSVIFKDYQEAYQDFLSIFSGAATLHRATENFQNCPALSGKQSKKAEICEPKGWLQI